MHLIPSSWPHLHILVSVFPSVGLIFALGFYVTAMATNNETMKRACLIVFCGLGLLSIPTFFSGIYSAPLFGETNPRVAVDVVFWHQTWSNVALGLLVLLGLAAASGLFRTPAGGRISKDSQHLVLGIGVLTLLMMIVCAEIGWEVNHHELALGVTNTVDNPSTYIGGGAGTPQAWSHFHIILNHFPTVGFVFTLFFFIYGLVKNNDTMKRAGLCGFVICAILGAPTYVTGAAAMWALTDPPIAGITKAVINAHRDMAIVTLFGLAFTGGVAWIEVWRYRYNGRFTSNTALYVVLGLALITLAIMAETGHRGGQINHPEIHIAGDVLPTDAKAGWSPWIEMMINNIEYFVPWQTVHFFGYSLVFATVFAVALRVLGFWKSVPFSAIHRLLPLGVFGVMMNVFTGMLMLMADTFRYVNEISFVPKMALLPIGAIAVLYFSLSEKLWKLKAGEDAPMLAKWVAAFVLLSWIGVIMGGRLLPYI